MRITEPIDLNSVREREQRMKLHKWMNGVEEEEPAADEESKMSKKQKDKMTNLSQQKKVRIYWGILKFNFNISIETKTALGLLSANFKTYSGVETNA